MRGQWLVRSVLIICLLATATVVSAREVLNRTECVVEAGTVIEGTLFTLCEKLDILGEIDGDVIGVAIRTRIAGRVNGSVYLASGQLDISGTILRDVHFVGPVLRVHPYEAATKPEDEDAGHSNSDEYGLQGGIKAASLSVTVLEGARIAKGIINFGYQLIVHGEVGSEISFWGSALLVDSAVRSNIYATVGDPSADSSQIETLLLPFNFDVALRDPGFVLSDVGHIVGDLIYTGPAEGDIQGRVSGKTIFTPVTPTALPTLEEPATITIFISQLGREFTTLLAIGVIGLVAVPNLMQAPIRNLRTRPFASFSVGMLAFLLSFPVVLIMLLLSVVVLIVLYAISLSGVAVAVGIVLGLVNIGGVSLFYFVAIFVARAIIGLALGRFLLSVTIGINGDTRWLYISLIIGVLLLSAFASIPQIGWIINAASLFLGLGTILNVIMDQFRKIRDTAPAWYASSTAITHPHIPPVDVPHVEVFNPNSETADTGEIEEEEADERATQEAAVVEDDSPPPIPPDDVEESDYHGPGMQNLPEVFDPDFFFD